MSGTHGRLSVPKIRAWLSGWTGLESATEHMLTLLRAPDLGRVTADRVALDPTTGVCPSFKGGKHRF